MSSGMIRVAVVGARGHVGAELLTLLARHPRVEIVHVGSRERDGARLSDHIDGYAGDLRYLAPSPDGVVAAKPDAVFMALPNGYAAPYVAALDAGGGGATVIDLSADYRFDEGWHYGLPELTRARAASSRRIANPGCYATAMQLAIAPLKHELAAPAQCFGVSGYSGAGTTPSPKNDPSLLGDNLMPYALTGHVHEREVTRHLNHPVEFMPHVAPWFRGITMTVNLHLSARMVRDEIVAIYRSRYSGEPLIAVTDEPPWVSRIAGHHGVEIGGFDVAADRRRVVVVATLDNLLKGAATQALQNMNLAAGFDELLGIAR